jgi:hypothetical protein
MEPYALRNFGKMLIDDVPVVSESGELFFGWLHGQRYQKSYHTPKHDRAVSKPQRSPLRWVHSGDGGKRASFDPTSAP